MEPMLDQVRPAGQAHLECPCVPVELAGAGGGKPCELRGGERTHPSGGSGLDVAKHDREEGPRTAVAK